MAVTNILILVFGLGVFAFYLGRARSLAIAKPLGGIRYLHSLPSYYGFHSALWCALPALLLLALWVVFDDPLINSIVADSVTGSQAAGDTASYNLLMNKISNVSAGILPRDGRDPEILAAADLMTRLQTLSRWALTALILTLSITGLAWGWSRTSQVFRARQVVENVVEKLLLGCACVAIKLLITGQQCYYLNCHSSHRLHRVCRQVRRHARRHNNDHRLTNGA